MGGGNIFVVQGILAGETFTLVEMLPEEGKTVDAKWVNKWKIDVLGDIVKAKARLVAKLFSQQRRVDFLEVFSPAAKTATIRLLVVLAKKFEWDLSHFDVEQAFVQPDLCYEIYSIGNVFRVADRGRNGLFV